MSGGAKQHPPPSGSGRDALIQVPKSQLQSLTQEYDRVLARCKRQECQLKAFTNFSDVVSRQEQELRLHKKKAQQFESAYIASEAKLGHMLRTWINASQKSGGPPDVELLENILQFKTEDLYSKQFPNIWPMPDKESKDTTVRSVENDLEEDCDSDIEQNNVVRKDKCLVSNKGGDAMPKISELEIGHSVEKENTNKTVDQVIIKPELNDIEEDSGEKSPDVSQECYKNGIEPDCESSKSNKGTASYACVVGSLVPRGVNVGTDSISSVRKSKEILSDKNNSNLSATANSQKVFNKSKRPNLTPLQINKTELDSQGSLFSNVSDTQTESVKEQVNLTSLSRQTSTYSKEIIDKLVEKNRQLLKVISEYKEETPEGWKAFVEFKQYEDLVKNLRLEVASVRLQNSELKMLLVAKQGGNIDALTKKINDLDKQLVKLNKQLTAKHALLHSINTEYEKVKQPTPLPDDGEERTSDEWEMKYEELKVRFNECMDNTQKQTIEMKNIIERLRNEKENIEVQSQEYASIIEEMKKTRITVGDDIESNISLVQLREENEKLKADVDTYRHELDTKKKDEAIMEAQIHLYRDDYQKEIDSHKKERQEHEKEKSQLLNLVKSMEIKFNKCLEDLNLLKQVHNSCAEKERRLQSQFTQINKHLEQEQTRSQQIENELKLVKLQRSPQTVPQAVSNQRCHVPSMSQFHGGATFAGPGAAYACMLETDGPEDDLGEEQISTQHRQLKHLYSSQSAPGGLNTPPNDRRVVIGSSTHSSVKEELSVDGDASKKLECPQCYREFKPGEDQKYNDHVAKCMI